MLRKAAIVLAVSAIIVAVITVVYSAFHSASRGGSTGDHEGQGLLIVVTFPPLEGDVRALACQGDVVKSLVPPGVDPHMYSLRPSDMELLRKADLIVSTGHTPVELRIRELVASGELKARLLDIVELEGVRVYVNPVTGKPNYHSIIYDPHNYIVFIEELSKVLSSLRPSCSQHYSLVATSIVEGVREAVKRVPEVDIVAVADEPVVQYAVEWAGIHVELVLVAEEGLPPTPALVEKARTMISTGSVGLVVVVEGKPTEASAMLEQMAREHGVRVLEVPSPLDPRPFYEKIVDVCARLATLFGG